MISTCENIIDLGANHYLALSRAVYMKDGIPVSLSMIQFRIIYRLAHNLGEIIDSKQLIEFAWGPDSYITKQELWVYINRIRRKIEDDARAPRYLLTVYGTGYVLHPR